MIDRVMNVRSPIDRVHRKRKFLRRTPVFPLFLLRLALCESLGLQREKKMGGVLERGVCIFGALIGVIFLLKYIYKIVFYGSL